MNLSLFLPSGTGISKRLVTQITECNRCTSAYGLTLTPEQARELAAVRAETLQSYGRIGFGEATMLPKLLHAFCDSPYLHQQNYAETLEALTEIFYYFKNESLEQLSDDELLSFMKSYFDGSCQGSLELLRGLSLETLARRLRDGLPAEEEQPIGRTEEEENDDALD